MANTNTNTPWNELNSSFKNYLMSYRPDLVPVKAKQTSNDIKNLFNEECGRCGMLPVAHPSLEEQENRCDHFANGNLPPVYAAGKKDKFLTPQEAKRH
ncbi:MAG: hypothetical protein NTW62_00150 [Candidatus Nomurabacteria bacterium]|nr:hypothetical protein [Candidatus Nomurabacteria bacterium]